MTEVPPPQSAARQAAGRHWSSALAWTFHSFVFAALPNIVFLAANMRQLPVTVSDAARAAAWLFGINLILLLILARWRRLQSTAVTLSSFYVALSFYATASRIRAALSIALPEGWWASLYVLLCALLAVWVGRPLRGADYRYRTLNAAAAALIVTCGVIALLETPGLASRRFERAIASLTSQAPTPRSVTQAAPDVYYIILDGLGRPDVLQQNYGVDMSGELDTLTGLGWNVLRRSRANYPQTYLSVASAMNGVYLDELAAVMGTSSDRRPLYDLIQRSGAIVGLKRIGYRFTLIGSNTSVTQSHQLADSCFCSRPGLTEFENGLLSMTPFSELPLYRQTHLSHYRTIVSSFNELDRVPDSGAPVFVLAHIMAPHPPFVVDRHGQPIVVTGPVLFRDADHFAGTKEDYRSGYREQTIFVMSRLVQFATKLSHRTRPAVVVVHGDHGPGLGYSHHALARSSSTDRYPILMAIRFAGQPPVPREDLSPVNVFRVIFNAHFGTNYSLLPDRTFYAAWDQPYQFTEVDSP